MVEQLRQSSSLVEHQKIIETHIGNLEAGMWFFLTENVETFSLETRKMVLDRMIERGNVISRKVQGFSISERRQIADKIIPLVDSAKKVASIFLWDNKKDVGSLIVDSLMSESQMRALTRRAHIRNMEEGINFLSSRPLNFPADELPKIVKAIIPYIDRSSAGNAFFIERGATSFREGTTNVPRAPIDKKIIEAYTLSESLITDIVNATLPYINTVESGASFISILKDKHPDYPLTKMIDHMIPLIRTAVDGITFFSRYRTIRALSKAEAGRLVRHIAPLITNAEEGKQLIEVTRELVDRYMFNRPKFRHYLSKEDRLYLIDTVVSFFNSKEELKILNTTLELEFQERRYARRSMKRNARQAQGQGNIIHGIATKLMKCMKSFSKKVNDRLKTF